MAEHYHATACGYKKASSMLGFIRIGIIKNGIKIRDRNMLSNLHMSTAHLSCYCSRLNTQCKLIMAVRALNLPLAE